jgi:hypothetical protein
MTGGMIMGMLCVGMFLALILTAVIVKVREVRRARTWMAVEGKVVVSKVGTKEIEPGEIGYNSSDSNVRNYPYVEYEYVVEGKKLRAHQIALGEIASADELEATLARYPVGMQVTVFCNPEKPTEACLERDLPDFFWKGLGCLALLFVGGPLLVAMIYFWAVDWFKGHLPVARAAPIVSVLCIMGFFTAWFALAFSRMTLQARRWPSTVGTILRGEVQQFEDWDNDLEVSAAARRRFKPAIRYRYEVNGRSYIGDRIRMGVDITSSVRSLAQKTLKRYPPGRDVDVYYNPEKPGEAVLEPISRFHLFPWLMAIGLFALAWAIGTGRLGAGA